MAAPASHPRPTTISEAGYSPVLDSGFRKLYELDFSGARDIFLGYERSNPGDPLGATAMAASYLYEEFDSKGIFTSEFFLNDARFLHGADGTPAENHNALFLRADSDARTMAGDLLKMHPHDVRGMLALTLADGMESDYDALMVKNDMASLGWMRQAEREAKALLIIDPSQGDAYVAVGASDYVIGCMPAYKRTFLWLDGVRGGRARGMREMQRAADRGHYLRPFAKILLALASEREHQPERARRLLRQLAREFPENGRFAHELALLNARHSDE